MEEQTIELYGEDADELFELYQASEETLGRLIAVYGPLPGKPRLIERRYGILISLLQMPTMACLV